MMEFLRCTMSAFAVLGKEDSTQNKNKDWIQRLWKDFNEHPLKFRSWLCGMNREIWLVSGAR